MIIWTFDLQQNLVSTFYGSIHFELCKWELNSAIVQTISNKKLKYNFLLSLNSIGIESTVQK